MRVCIIFNPTARGDKARHFRESLGALGPGIELKPTTGPGTAPALAQEAAREGFEIVVAAGGDGTVNEVVNGLANHEGGLARCALGIIPFGTVNVFAQELGIPPRLEAAWRVIHDGVETRVDLPWVEPGGPSPAGRRWFAQLAGAGLDSRSIALVDWTLKTRIGRLAYVWAGLRALRGPQPKVRVRIEGREVVGELVLVGNGRYYGGRIPMFPGADLRDGMLDVRVFPRAGWLALSRFGWQWVTRSFWVPRDQLCLRAARFELSSDQPLPFELDGDNVGCLPVAFGVQREALRVRVPRGG